MKKLFTLSALALLFASANTYAHHPAVDMVDPEVYAMIEENISDEHLALTFDDMGSDTAAGSAMQARDDEVGSMSADMQDAGSAMEAREAMADMADVVPAGPMGTQR